MSTTDLKNIIPYIGETEPYLFIPENITLNNDRIVEAEITNCNFKNENFTNLLKILSSLGSCNLYKILNTISKEKIYFLGEKLRIRKISYKTLESISITCESFLESNKKGKSYLNVKDLSSREILYSFELDYYIILQNSFESIYKDYFNSTPIEYYNEKLPESVVNIENNSRLTILIEPFTLNQCKGHFDKYPIVPAVFVANCILKKNFNFLGSDSLHEVDSLEMYMVRAMPIEKELTVNISHQKLLKSIMYFECKIRDISGMIYGTYFINIKSI